MIIAVKRVEGARTTKRPLYSTINAPASDAPYRAFIADTVRRLHRLRSGRALVVDCPKGWSSLKVNAGVRAYYREHFRGQRMRCRQMDGTTAVMWKEVA